MRINKKIFEMVSPKGNHFRFRYYRKGGKELNYSKLTIAKGVIRSL